MSIFFKKWHLVICVYGGGGGGKDGGRRGGKGGGREGALINFLSLKTIQLYTQFSDR